MWWNKPKTNNQNSQTVTQQQTINSGVSSVLSGSGSLLSQSPPYSVTTGTPITWTNPGSLTYRYADSVVDDAIRRIQSQKEEEIVTIFIGILQYVDKNRRIDFLKQLIPFINFFNRGSASYSEENIVKILDNLEPHLAKVDYNSNFKNALKD